MAPAEHEIFLRIYLNDQLALGVLWREVARRAQRANAGSPAGDALAEVAAAIAEDVRTIERLMERLQVPRNPVKPVLAAIAERLGRLKLNGRIRAYSPLSRFTELDILVLGIEEKKTLWENLRGLAGLHDRLPDVDFAGLIERAERQRALLEPHRRAAGRQALGAIGRSEA